MKLSPISSNLNNQIRNNKIQNQPKLRPMASDSISFSAKIPENIQAELRYNALQETTNGRDTAISASKDPKIVELLQKLRKDTTISSGFKRKILLQKPNGLIYNPLVMRIQESACNSQNMSLLQKNTDYQVAKALLEASPDVETTRQLLLTPNRDEIPLFGAGKDEAKLLLAASPDKETLRAQVFARNKYGERAIEVADKTTRKVILSFCDKQMKKELLTNPADVKRIFMDGKIEELLALAGDKETRLQILQSSENGVNLLHRSGGDYVKYFALKLRRHPEILKKLLLQKDECGRLPMDWCNSDLNVANDLFEISPDKETRRAQLLAHPGQYGERLVVLSEKYDLEEFNPLQKPIYYLKASPDDKTLFSQLDSVVHYRACSKPIKSCLGYCEYTEVLQTFKSVQNKKKFLLDTWQETEPSMYGPMPCMNSVAQKMKKLYDSCYYKNGEEVEKFGKILIEIINDDSTTEQEALELIELYKDSVSSATREYLSQLVGYFKVQLAE